MCLKYTQIKNAAHYASEKLTDLPPIGEMDLIIAGAGGELVIYWHNGTQIWTALYSFKGEIPNTQSPVKWLPISKSDLGRLTANNEIETHMFDPTSNDWELLPIGRKGKMIIDAEGFRAAFEDCSKTKFLIPRSELYVLQDELNEWLSKIHSTSIITNLNEKKELTILKKAEVIKQLSGYSKLKNEMGKKDSCFESCRVPKELSPRGVGGYYYFESVEKICVTNWGKVGGNILPSMGIKNGMPFSNKS